MERKTKVHATEGKQEIFITREFDLPLRLLFRAYSEAALIEQWMGNKVLELESKPHGSYQFETQDDQGNILFRANGVIHEFIPDHKVTRTFQMENTPFPVQLEFLEFTALTEKKSKLTIHIIYKTIEDRDLMLQMPFAGGINAAHNRLQGMIGLVN